MTAVCKGALDSAITAWRRLRLWRSTHDQPITAIPSYAWRRLQERWLQRNKAALDKRVSLDDLPLVRLTRVETTDQCEQLVALYWRNPSSLVSAPRTVKALERCFAKGIEYYLVYNEDNELVGARAIRIKDAFVVHSTIDRRFRRQGYWLASEDSFCRFLAKRGFTQLITSAFRQNTAIIRSAVAAGWVAESHPTHQAIVRLTKTL